MHTAKVTKVDLKSGKGIMEFTNNGSPLSFNFEGGWIL